MSKKLSSKEIKDVLMKKTLKELYPYAKMLGLKNLKAYKKDALCQSMCEPLVNMYHCKPFSELFDKEVVEERLQAIDEELWGDVPPAKYSKEIDRTKYLEGAKDGTIVAFQLPNGKVKSAAIVTNDIAGKRLLLETKYKKKFRVAYKDVIWVRTGTRFPKGVYNLLKGNGVVDGE